MQKFGQPFPKFGQVLGVPSGTPPPGRPSLVSIGGKDAAYPMAVASTTPTVSVSALYATSVTVYVYDTGDVEVTHFDITLSGTTGSGNVNATLTDNTQYTLNLVAHRDGLDSDVSPDYIFYCAALASKVTWLAALGESSDGSGAVPRYDLLSSNNAPDATHIASTPGAVGLAALMIPANNTRFDFPALAGHNNVVSGEAFTYGFIVHFVGVPASGSQGIFGEAVAVQPGSTGAFSFSVNTTPRVNVNVRDSSGANNALLNSSNLGVAAGSTYIFWLTYDPVTRVIRANRNNSTDAGGVAATLGVGVTVNPSTLDLRVGAVVGNDTFNGWIQYVMKFNAALSETERGTIYTSLITNGVGFPFFSAGGGSTPSVWADAFTATLATRNGAVETAANGGDPFAFSRTVRFHVYHLWLQYQRTASGSLIDEIAALWTDHLSAHWTDNPYGYGSPLYRGWFNFHTGYAVKKDMNMVFGMLGFMAWVLNTVGGYTSTVTAIIQYIETEFLPLWETYWPAVYPTLARQPIQQGIGGLCIGYWCLWQVTGNSAYQTLHNTIKTLLSNAVWVDGSGYGHLNYYEYSTPPDPNAYSSYLWDSPYPYYNHVLSDLLILHEMDVDGFSTGDSLTSIINASGVVSGINNYDVDTMLAAQAKSIGRMSEKAYWQSNSLYRWTPSVDDYVPGINGEPDLTKFGADSGLMAYYAKWSQGAGLTVETAAKWIYPLMSNAHTNLIAGGMAWAGL